jgi:hypothetical protein
LSQKRVRAETNDDASEVVVQGELKPATAAGEETAVADELVDTPETGEQLRRDAKHDYQEEEASVVLSLEEREELEELDEGASPSKKPRADPTPQRADARDCEEEEEGSGARKQVTEEEEEEEEEVGVVLGTAVEFDSATAVTPLAKQRSVRKQRAQAVIREQQAEHKPSPAKRSTSSTRRPTCRIQQKKSTAGKPVSKPVFSSWLPTTGKSKWDTTAKTSAATTSSRKSKRGTRDTALPDTENHLSATNK